MPGKLIHTGQAIVDLVLNVHKLPPRGGDLFAHQHAMTAGGGFNVMAAAARQRVRVVYAGQHGQGPFGDIIRAALQTEGIETIAPPWADSDTGFCVAFVEPGGERTFVSTLGAEGHPTRELLDASEVTADDVVYVSGYSLAHPTNGRLLSEWLPTCRPLEIVFDPSPLVGEVQEDLLHRILDVATCVTANLSEAQQLAEIFHVPVSNDPRETSTKLASRFDAAVVVRCDADGCVVADRETDAVQIPPYPVTAIDANGAGDAHTGVVCAELLRGANLGDAATRGNGAAAIAVTRTGPATCPTREEIDTIITVASRRRSNMGLAGQ